MESLTELDELAGTLLLRMVELLGPTQAAAVLERLKRELRAGARGACARLQ